jgi:hypothetical protein
MAAAAAPHDRSQLDASSVRSGARAAALRARSEIAVSGRGERRQQGCERRRGWSSNRPFTDQGRREIYLLEQQVRHGNPDIRRPLYDLPSMFLLHSATQWNC